jgi:nucleoside-diphosphate-sugar epimerase
VTTSAFVTGGSGFIGGELADPASMAAGAAGCEVAFHAAAHLGTRLIETQGVTPSGRSIPAPVANAVATMGETASRMLPLPGRPPLTRLAVWLSALETTIDITRARTELGYAPVRTVDEGLEELRQP